MNPSQQLEPLLRKLRLAGVLQTLELRIQQAVEDDLAHPEFLLRLFSDEVERREQKQLELRMRRAKFDPQKTLNEFDFNFNTNIPKTKIIDLATGLFVARHENVIFIGPAGVGKSHLAQALGHKACLLGHSVLYTSADKILTSFRAARADHSYDQTMAKLESIDVLIIDDLGLRDLIYDEPLDLYQLIRDSYEKRSLIITSNRAIEEWIPLFGNPLLASAALDRLIHHAHIISVDGPSYRNPPAKWTTLFQRKSAQ